MIYYVKMSFSARFQLCAGLNLETLNSIFHHSGGQIEHKEPKLFHHSGGQIEHKEPELFHHSGGQIENKEPEIFHHSGGPTGNQSMELFSSIQQYAVKQ